MKYSLLILLFFTFFITSCWGEKSEVKKTKYSKKEVSVNEKKWEKYTNSNEFLIETKKIIDFDNSSSIQKIGKIISNQNLEIKSQVTWKILQIYVKNWQKVKIGETIAKIQDSYSKYYLELDKAEIDFDKQLINKDSQLLSLDQKIIDTKISLEDSRKNYENAKKTAESDTKKAKIDFEKSNLWELGTQAKLEYDKAELDFENTISANEEKIKTYIENVKKEHNNLYLSIWDIIRFSDELLWVTEENKNKAKVYKNYLGIKNSILKNETKEKLLELIEYKTYLLELELSNITEENIKESIDSFYEWYWKTKTLLDYLERTLENSITSVNSLSQIDIDWFISKINSYQSSNQNNLSSISSTKNSINSFLNTYKKTELSAFKNVELQKIKLESSSDLWKINYDKTIISIQNTLNSYETRFKQSEQGYNNSVKNREVNIRSLDNSIASASNSKNKASREYSKLNITSPINWIISSINIDKSEDVSNWTKLFSIISDTNTQIEVSLNKNEISEINLWDKVNVQYSKENFEWEVYSKSSLANSILDYNVIIILNKKIDLLWGSTIVNFSWKKSVFLLPLDIITIEWDNYWTINILKDWKKEILKVNLSKIDWNNVEILSKIPKETQIIITDLKNFNQLTQTFKIKK